METFKSIYNVTLMMELDQGRKERYLEKLQHAEESLLKLEEWIGDADKDEKSYAASAKEFQEAIEALTDVFALLVKDHGKLPKDDYTNIERLEELGVLSKDEGKLCREANGLRNVIVHKYNHVDRMLFIESANSLLGPIKSVLCKLRALIENE